MMKKPVKKSAPQKQANPLLAIPLWTLIICLIGSPFWAAHNGGDLRFFSKFLFSLFLSGFLLLSAVACVLLVIALIAGKK